MINQQSRLKSEDANEPALLAQQRLDPLPDDIAALINPMYNLKSAASAPEVAKRLRAKPPLDDETVRLFQEALAQAKSDPRKLGGQK